jgi:tRNA(Met) C34 N-acetyltransferase TmcA
MSCELYISLTQSDFIKDQVHIHWALSYFKREIKLETPIRYSMGDNIEKWLHGLLCLDAAIMPKAHHQGCPHPPMCELFYVNRDTDTSEGTLVEREVDNVDFVRSSG